MRAALRSLSASALCLRSSWATSHRSQDTGGHGAGQRGRYGVSDLTCPVPLSAMEPEPVGEAMEPSHFANRHAARSSVVNWPRARERSPSRVGSSAQRVRKTTRREAKKARNGLHRAGSRRGETASRNLGVGRACAACQQTGVPFPAVAMPPTAAVATAHGLRVVAAGRGPVSGFNLVTPK